MKQPQQHSNFQPVCRCAVITIIIIIIHFD